MQFGPLTRQILPLYFPGPSKWNEMKANSFAHHLEKDRKQSAPPAPASNLLNCWQSSSRYFNRDCEVYEKNQAEHSQQVERSNQDRRPGTNQENWIRAIPPPPKIHAYFPLLNSPRRPLTAPGYDQPKRTMCTRNNRFRGNLKLRSWTLSNESAAEVPLTLYREYGPCLSRNEYKDFREISSKYHRQRSHHVQ